MKNTSTFGYRIIVKLIKETLKIFPQKPINKGIGKDELRHFS